MFQFDGAIENRAMRSVEHVVRISRSKLTNICCFTIFVNSFNGHLAENLLHCRSRFSQSFILKVNTFNV